MYRPTEKVFIILFFCLNCIQFGWD